MLSSVFFIVNARIGAEKTARFTRAILEHFTDIKHEIHLTEYGGHALHLAQRAVAEESSLVVAVGGDGTVNEVLQAVAESGVPMAIVPTGSGNGLARHCGIPLDIGQAVKLIRSGVTRAIDLGKANEHYFISNAGVGFDAWVCQRIRQTKSRGLTMYIRHVVANFFTYKAATYSITADGKTFVEKAYFLNVANGKEFGYGFEISPEASLEDGLLDMVLVKKINLLNGARFVWDGWRKKLHRNPHCLHIRAKRFEFRAPGLTYFQTDGDAHDCEGICRIDMYPRAIHLLIPENSPTL